MTTFYAQEVYVSKTVDDGGNPINAMDYWMIKPGGESFSIVVKNKDGKALPPIMYLYIDEQREGEYKGFDQRLIKNPDSSSSVHISYRFYADGKFRLEFKTPQKVEIASGEVTFIYEKPTGLKEKVTENYYEKTEIIFCDNIRKDTPIGVKESINLKRPLTNILIKAGKAFKSNRITADIWKRGEDDIEYGIFVETVNLKIKNNWDYTFFKYTFDSAGFYKFDFFNDDKVRISTKYITVKE